MLVNICHDLVAYAVKADALTLPGLFVVVVVTAVVVVAIVLVLVVVVVVVATAFIVLVGVLVEVVRVAAHKNTQRSFVGCETYSGGKSARPCVRERFNN